ncbi:MAG TPA: hypothetical protein VFX59_12845 [Polyangiales bacterium]|nr:hypothetical protein [Polyangiales bacterium]
MAELEAFDEFTVSVARDTWDTFRREPVLFLIAGAVGMLVSIVTLGVLLGPMTVGYIELVRKVRLGEPVAVSVLFRRMDTLVSSNVALFLVGVLATIGMFLLLLPGLLVIFFTTWSLFVIAYERAGGVDSLRQSITLARAFPMHTLALLFGIFVMHALGGLIVFGALLALPLGYIAMAVGYERLVQSPVGVYAAG